MVKMKKQQKARYQIKRILFRRRENFIEMYKPKPIKGLKVQYNGETYDKITYLSCSNEGISFEHMPNDNTSVYIRCKVNEAKIMIGDKEK